MLYLTVFCVVVKVLQRKKILKKEEEARVKLTDTQLNKLKSAAQNKTGTTLRVTKKSFQDEELLHKLFLTTRQKTSVRNAFAINILTEPKVRKSRLPIK